MSNEALFLIGILVDICAVFIAARLGREWLYGTIAINLVLIGIFGAKLVTIAGVTMNAGNTFYACVFLATYFLIEQYGVRVGWQTIWYGAFIVGLFAIMSQLTALMSGTSQSELVNTASSVLFSFTPRIIAGSILAYIFSQYINIAVFEWLRNRTRGAHLWLRSLCANFIGQGVDSALFFSIAFIDLPGPVLVQVILVSWLVKSMVGSLGVPLIYLNVPLKSRKNNDAKCA